MSLLSQQKAAIKHLERWKVGALFMEAGTGKTRAALEIINSIKSIDCVLWIAPLRTITTNDNTSIIKEIERWGGFNVPVRYYGVESIGQSSRIFLEVMHYIEESKSVFMVVDESLKIKNAGAQRTKRVIELGKHAEYRLVLNGTPITKNLLDIWTQMEFLSPQILQMSSRQFKNTFCQYTKVTKRIGYKFYTREFITGYENIDYLYSLIRHYVYECDLSLNIQQNYEEIIYEVGREERELYEYLKFKYLDNDALIWKNNNIFLELTQKMQHVYCCTSSKNIALKELFELIPQDKTIIYCKYIDSRRMCETLFTRAKVLSYQREALGLNLQEYHYTVYFDKIWDLALRIQAGRRTFRTGQIHDCKYYDLTGNIGLEHVIDDNIRKKVSMLEYFKSKTKDEILNEL